MVKTPPTFEKVLSILEQVTDPEIPVLTIVDMGMVRDAVWDAASETLQVKITPTYSGCPAMKVIEDDVRAALGRAGFERVAVELVFAPAWTTDWLKPEAREKLRKYGIAPPGKTEESLVAIGKKRAPVECPYCQAKETELRSEFGATACKAFYYCRSCRQPFEHFKPI